MRCRLCRRGFSHAVPDGCDVCAPAKQNIVWDETDMAPSLEELTAQMARMFKTQMDRLENEMNESVGGKAGMKYPGHTKELQALGNALAKLVGEARKLDKQHSAAVRDMTFEEKGELVAEFFADLPEQHKQKLLKNLVKQLPAA